MQLHDAQGKRLYLTADERVAFLAAAAKAVRPVRHPSAVVLHTTGCRVSEALALTPEHVDLTGRALVFETLKQPGGASTAPSRCRLVSSIISTWCMASARPSGAARVSR